MKATIRLSGFILLFATFLTHAQMQTLVVSPTATNSAIISVPVNSYAVVRSADYSYGGTLLINIQGVSFAKDLSIEGVNGLTISGPATIQLQAQCCLYMPSFATIEVVPGPFPPDKTATVGAYSGNVQVTMQMSTDLVNWTPAVNGMVYTNSPDARFFRIQLVKNVQAP
jgi:hypothetical protein